MCATFHPCYRVLEMSKRAASEHGKALSDLGAARGGRARANTLTPEERSEIAKRAAEARWEKAGKRKENKVENENPAIIDPMQSEDPQEADPDNLATEASMPYSMFPGKLKIGDVEMECHVLSNGSRVLTQREMVRMLSGGRESGNLQRYLERNPLTAHDFELGPTVRFLVPGTSVVAIGHEATQLIELCDKYLQAREMKLLKKSQLGLAAQAEIVMRATAKIGIVSLIDEVTGFQKVRAQNALQLKLQAFIADELQEWARMFPEEFWVELARLEGIRYSPRSRPLRWGRYVMMFVYDSIDPAIGNWLRENNPNPHYKENHHQWMKKFGREKVHDQITKVVTIMKLCRDMADFRAKFGHVFKNTPLQLTFDDFGWNLS
jgi:hypothetical protein